MAKRQFQLTEEEIMAFRQAEAQTRDVRISRNLARRSLYGGVRLVVVPIAPL